MWPNINLAREEEKTKMSTRYQCHFSRDTILEGEAPMAKLFYCRPDLGCRVRFDHHPRSSQLLQRSFKDVVRCSSPLRTTAVCYFVSPGRKMLAQHLMQQHMLYKAFLHSNNWIFNMYMKQDSCPLTSPELPTHLRYNATDHTIRGVCIVLFFLDTLHLILFS